MASNIHFHLLHSRTELLEETASLINLEWHRSMGARLASIQDGCDQLPCSIVMTRQLKVGEGQRVIGHARLMAVMGNPDAALIETVIVLPELRGRGLGRRLMEEAENQVVKAGFKSLHLSTHDKQIFYSRLGYLSGPPVSGRRKCIATLSSEQAQSLLDDARGGSPNMDELSPVQESDLHTLPAPSPVTFAPPPPVTFAPPPPPPPRVFNTGQTASNGVITWMMKPLL